MLRQNRVLIDMDAIRSNYLVMQNLLPESVPVMPVIKANAYGHGMIETARELSRLGASHFAVAIPEEGIELRLAGIEGEILVLGAAMPRAAHDAIAFDLTQTVFTPDLIRILEEEAERQEKEALIHIKLDTGMNRIGLRSAEEAQALAKALDQCERVRATGIYTHFADADSPDGSALNTFSMEQLQRFNSLRRCFDPAIPAHAANSAAGLLAPEAYFSMVREGISLYGYPPVETQLAFRPALKWLTEVVNVKTLSAGDTIGYGRTFTAQREMRIATVAVGYGDGYHRMLSNRGQMLIRGQRAPIVGRVCMDQTMVDVTHIPDVVPGDEVVLIGTQGNETIDAQQVAEWAQTISYEVLLSITQRVPRFYEHMNA